MNHLAKRNVYDPQEPSMLADAFEAEAYRQGRIDGLAGKAPEPYGAAQYHMAAYRQGYNDGEEERGPPIGAWIKITAGSIVVTGAIAVAVWLILISDAIWR